MQIKTNFHVKGSASGLALKKGPKLSSEIAYWFVCLSRQLIRFVCLNGRLETNWSWRGWPMETKSSIATDDRSHNIVLRPQSAMTKTAIVSRLVLLLARFARWHLFNSNFAPFARAVLAFVYFISFLFQWPVFQLSGWLSKVLIPISFEDSIHFYKTNSEDYREMITETQRITSPDIGGSVAEWLGRRIGNLTSRWICSR